MSQSNTTSSTTSARALSDAESESVAIAQALDAVAVAGAANSEEDKAVPLGLFWDEWARCIGSGYQSDSLYRHGRLDSCGKQWKDLKLALEARLVQWRNPRRAQDLLDSTYYRKRTTISPTAGAIWELKERPGWN